MKNKYLWYSLICLAVCAIVAGAVYAAHSLAEKKLTQYEDALAAAEVTMNVTTPTGMDTKTEVLEDGSTYEKKLTLLIYSWVVDIFSTRTPVPFYDVSDAEDPKDSAALREMKKQVAPKGLSLAEYVKDIRYMTSYRMERVNDYSFTSGQDHYLNGISSLSCDPLLVSEEECEITWYEGYDESVFAGGGLYCLIPEGKVEQFDNGNGEAVVTLAVKGMKATMVNGEIVKESYSREHQCTLKIVGTYTGGDWNSIYCPIPIVEQACEELETIQMIRSFSATLADNTRLDEFREKMCFCFLEPSPENDDVPWGYFAGSQYHQYYPLALDIDDEALCDLPDVTGEVEKLESIVKIGVIVLAVTVAAIPAGCLVIFISNKKKAKAE